MIARTQPWLSNPVREILLIMAPALLPVAAVLLFQNYFTQSDVNTFWWVLLVLAIDVSHVYSTLFRLYWDRSTVQKYKVVLYTIPILSFVVGFMLHAYDSLLFWRVLAYVAVFHFIRQQYGFMRLYSRQDNASRTNRLIDTVAIYAGTVYPLLYWHLHLTHQLAWFVKGDFYSINLTGWDTILFVLYGLVIAVYCCKEILMAVKQRFINIPKNLIMAGTYLSWYVGIVLFQGDLIFTLLNVVAHGIPYMGLIWIYGERKSKQTFSFSIKGVLIFVGVLLVLAYMEEGFWDVLIWKDHQDVFPFLTTFKPLQNPFLVSLAVSILVLPQVTHYVLDGFIWRFSKDSQSRL